MGTSGFKSGSQSGSQSQTVLSEINVTPLVDVMLVLLIMFMVTAPLLQQGLEVEVPKTKGSGFDISQEPIRIIIDVGKKIKIEKKTVALNQLSQHLTQLLRGRKNQQVFIEADRRIDYGFVAQVMAEVKASGATSLGLVTLPQQ